MDPIHLIQIYSSGGGHDVGLFSTVKTRSLVLTHFYFIFLLISSFCFVIEGKLYTLTYVNEPWSILDIIFSI